MCGIFALLNYDANQNYTNQTNDLNNINKQFMKGQKRGPESSILKNYLKCLFGFHRLAINGLNEISNQPLELDDISLICNGEIYNYKELFITMNIVPRTGSDCEVIIHMYKKYGIEQTLTMLDGVFSFILYDGRIQADLSNHIYVARDPLGVRPLYVLKPTNNNNNNNYVENHGSTRHPLKKSFYGFASELKCLSSLYNSYNDFDDNTSNHNQINNSYCLEPFTPGTYSLYTISGKSTSMWKPVKENMTYFIPAFSYFNNSRSSVNYYQISYFLQSAVVKRCFNTERPIACLLSGGLDSSLICALVNEYYKTHSKNKQLETYSIGLAESEDLKYARIVADYLGTKHTEVIVTEQEMFEAIPEVIYAIESYDTTTVRASIGNYLLGKYISKHSEAKVIFNGDGSDELCGGYMYMNYCPDDIEFDRETRRLLKDIHLFDVLRSDKCISSHGLEPRTPFLDKTFVNYYLSIAPSLRNHKNEDGCEKILLRNTFSKTFIKSQFRNIDGKNLLPGEILWRKKEAFSDGVSGHGRSLYQILQEFIAAKLNELNETGKETFPVNIETEKYYYRSLFVNFYPNLESVIPYYWMPKYTEAKDPSARTLGGYTISTL